MSLESLRKTYDNFYVPRFEVHLSGRVVRESDGIVSDLSVNTVLDGADTVSFRLNYPFDREKGEFRGLTWADWEPSTKLRIRQGYGDTFEQTFVGRIQSVKPDFPSGGSPTVTVSGFGLLHDLTKETRSRSWDDQRLGDVVRDVLSRYDLKADVRGADLKRRKIYQNNQNDFQFLTKLANDYGFEFFGEQTVAHFRPRTLQQRTPDLTLRYGESLTSFSPELNTADTVKTVEVRHWNPDTKSEIVGKATRSEGSGKKVVQRPVESKEEAETVAAAILARLSAAAVEGSGESVGIPKIDTGTVLKIEGVGSIFTKVYYVKRATHSMSNSGYTTSFEVREYGR